MNKKDNNKIIFVVIIFLLLVFIGNISNNFKKVDKVIRSQNSLRILSSYENKMMEEKFKDYDKGKKIDVEFIYKGDLDIVDELNKNVTK